MWRLDQKITKLGGLGSPTLDYHSAKFRGHRYCGSVDISLFHLSRDHVIKRSRDFEVFESYHPAKFAGNRYCGSPDIRFYICYVTTSSKGHVTCWMLYPVLSTTLSILVVLSMSYGKEDVIFPVPIPIPIPISMFAYYQNSA